MDSQCPPHWTFAARAAYFGERMCSFCDHRNPAGAKFCNECAFPLHLKPCNQCDAINDQAATNCYKCGAACPVSFGAPVAAPVLPEGDAEPAPATPGDLAAATGVTQPLSADSAWRAGPRLLSPGQFLLAAIGTAVIAVAYSVYRVPEVTPDTTRVASQPIGAAEHNEPTAGIAVRVPEESKVVEPERTATVEVPVPATALVVSERAASQRLVPVPSAKRASARQRPPLDRRAAPPPPAGHSIAVARLAARTAERRKALRPEPQVMHVNLSRCGGDLIARIACTQRVRRNFCEGHWGAAPECASGVPYEHRP
jgi:hypothetical protein